MGKSGKYVQAKLYRAKRNNQVEKRLRNSIRVFGGAASVREATGQMPVGSRQGPVPVEDEDGQ